MKYKSYDLYEKKEKYNNTKSFRKYLQIVPAFKHVPYKPLIPIGKSYRKYKYRIDVICLELKMVLVYGIAQSNYYIKLRVTSKKQVRSLI